MRASSNENSTQATFRESCLNGRQQNAPLPLTEDHTPGTPSHPEYISHPGNVTYEAPGRDHLLSEGLDLPSASLYPYVGFTADSSNVTSDPGGGADSSRYNGDCWVVDIGSPRHITNNKAILRNIRTPVTFEGLVGVYGIDNPIKFTCEGEIVLRSFVNGTTRTITLHNVLFCPKMPTNIFSVREHINTCRGKVEFGSSRVCVLSEDRTAVLSGVGSGSKIHILDMSAKLAESNRPAPLPLMNYASSQSFPTEEKFETTMRRLDGVNEDRRVERSPRLRRSRPQHKAARHRAVHTMTPHRSLLCSGEVTRFMSPPLCMRDECHNDQTFSFPPSSDNSLDSRLFIVPTERVPLCTVSNCAISSPGHQGPSPQSQGASLSSSTSATPTQVKDLSHRAAEKRRRSSCSSTLSSSSTAIRPQRKASTSVPKTQSSFAGTAQRSIAGKKKRKISRSSSSSVSSPSIRSHKEPSSPTSTQPSPTDSNSQVAPALDLVPFTITSDGDVSTIPRLGHPGISGTDLGSSFAPVSITADGRINDDFPVASAAATRRLSSGNPSRTILSSSGLRSPAAVRVRRYRNTHRYHPYNDDLNQATP